MGFYFHPMAIVKQVLEILGVLIHKVVDDHLVLELKDGRCHLHDDDQHLGQSASRAQPGKDLATPHHVFLHEPPLKLLALNVVLFPPIVYLEDVPKIVDEEGCLGCGVVPQDDPTADHGICGQ
jgi:hypothetical protein